MNYLTRPRNAENIYRRRIIRESHSSCEISASAKARNPFKYLRSKSVKDLADVGFIDDTSILFLKFQVFLKLPLSLCLLCLYSTHIILSNFYDIIYIYIYIYIYINY